MKSFNMKRFGLLMRWSLTMNARKMAALAAGCMFAMLAIMVATTQININMSYIDDMEYQTGNLRAAVVTCRAVLIILFCAYSSWILGNMRSKQERTMYMMLPVSDFERFLARYVSVTFGTVVCGLAAFCAADVLRIVISLFTGRSPLVSAVPMMFEQLGEIFTTNDMDGIVFSLLWLLWLHTCYLLGGVLFRSRQFILTSASLLALGIAFVWLLESGVGWMDNLSGSFDKDTAAVVFCSVPAVLSAFNYWLSFRLYRRMQVINNKWLNV